MNRKYLPVTFAASAALAAALLLSGCSSSGSMDSTDSNSTTPAPSSAASQGEFNDADVAFASGMVMHHQQAIEMVDMFLEKEGVDEQVADLAERIKAAQQPEIDTMNQWLTAWAQPTDSMGDHNMDDMGDMDGMMSGEDMMALENATAEEANTLFLEQMVTHHLGAIDMATEELDSGQNAEALGLATKIITDQRAEIDEMSDLLAAL
ncbi:MAG TPA: DUF305 domain-containing protein [Glaciihabitans sp.]|jgi:uncharacterized protein (DUF305 family)|nr:DUF305 domain-containing protein [Glaciihabitans sp.]